MKKRRILTMVASMGLFAVLAVGCNNKSAQPENEKGTEIATVVHATQTEAVDPSKELFGSNTSTMTVKKDKLKLSDESLESIAAIINGKEFKAGSTIDFSTLDLSDEEKNHFDILFSSVFTPDDEFDLANMTVSLAHDISITFEIGDEKISIKTSISQ